MGLRAPVVCKEDREIVKRGIKAFSGKHVLLLQGPLGPFFRRLACDLKASGARVSKVNFNGGDCLFYPTGALCFRGRMDEWPPFLSRLLADRKIDVVLMYGDCRPIHRCVRAEADRLGVEVGVFEAGYVRPNYITLERSGINDYSTVPRAAHFYLTVPAGKPEPPLAVGKVFWHAALWAVLYYLASATARRWFPHYQHHRPLQVREALPWFRGLWRKGYYQVAERGLQRRLESDYSGRFFLVPLQVHYDSQMHVHSDFTCVPAFIRTVVSDFAKNAPSDTYLVIKHHPMDRAYQDYTTLCAQLTRDHSLHGRVFYAHDLDLPKLYRHTRGVIVVNSTVGLSALLHGVSVKVCGRAIYDIPNLTYAGALSDFWAEAQNHKPDVKVVQGFRAYLLAHTQLNGSVYKRLPIPGSHAGIVWTGVEPTANDPGRASEERGRMYVRIRPTVAERGSPAVGPFVYPEAGPTRPRPREPRVQR